MWQRIRWLVRGRLEGEWFGERGSRVPAAPLLFQALVASALLFVVRGDLDAHGHSVFVLTLLAALNLLSLLGELAPLLASDPAEEWVGGLPVTAREVRLSKIAVCLLVTFGMSLGVLLPAILLAPPDMTWPARLALAGLGLVQSVFLTALGLLLHRAFQGTRGGALILLQAALFVGLFVGFVAGLGRANLLAGWTQTGGWWLLLPSTWYAAPLAPEPLGPATALLVASVLLALAILWFAPFPSKSASLGTSSLTGTLLRPLAALLRRIWVRPAERPVFDWIYTALPAEKDYGLRTYPLLAIPLAFLFLGAEGTKPEGQGLLAILSFAPLTYLPILLMFVPATATPAARVLIDSAPLEPAVEREGARKALAVRVILPLYLLLLGVLWVVAGWKLAVQLVPPAAALTVLLLRTLWPRYVDPSPLASPAQELGGAWRDDLTGGMFVMALISVVAALATWKYVPGPLGGCTVAVGLLLLEAVLCRLPVATPRRESV
ncbi:MAG: hypothetical protein R3F17_12815 [Planctomycetota bacterium]